MIGAVVVSLLVECTLVMSRAPNYDDYETDDYEGRIWRGNHTTHEKHPYFAAIVAGTGQEDYLCGGAFVTSEMVITAGHCVFGKIPSRVTIKYGINELYGTPGKQMKAQAIYIHPKFDNKFTSSNPNMLPDIALVKLKGSIDDKAMLINLPEPGEDENYVNRWSSTLVAMGASFNGEKNYDLKAVRTKLILSPRCWPHTDTKLTVCAFGDYSGYRTCPGDSGSPVTAKTQRGRVILAVDSANMGFKCSTDKYREMNGLARYARVSGVMIWILDTILERSRCSCFADMHRRWVLHESEHK